MQIELITKNLPLIFCALFVSVLFIQSGLDKIFDWKGNLGWLKGHFSETFLAGMVPMMLGVITVMELATGALAGVGLVYLLVAGTTQILFISSIAGAASLTALFFGQRIAKDYPGAAVLVPYFLLVLAMMYLSMPPATS